MNQNSGWISSYIRLTQLGQHVSIDLAKKNQAEAWESVLFGCTCAARLAFSSMHPAPTPTSPKVLSQLLVSGSHYIQPTVLHALSGLLFLSCSSPVTRGKWIPALTVFEEDNAVVEDYICLDWCHFYGYVVVAMPPVESWYDPSWVHSDFFIKPSHPLTVIHHTPAPTSSKVADVTAKGAVKVREMCQHTYH